MCGIAGIYRFKDSGKNSLSSIAESMATAMERRGPDDAGVWSDENSGIALSHRRLSIIDLSPEGHQPMPSATGRYIMSFNGEIYNFQNLSRQLTDLGHNFRGRSDTEVMLAAFEQWGVNLSIQKFEGMFAFALWDAKERQLHLIRDRIGKKPLYAGWAGDSLVFASELKAIRQHPDFKPEINRSALTLFMRYSSIPAPYSIYENIWTIPAGCRLAISASTITPRESLIERMEPWWHHTQVIERAKDKLSSSSDEETIKEFEELLSTCVRERMVSDVPIGAFLSGGIDSSAIVALMQKESSRPVKTYSIGFNEKGFNEAEYAKKIASYLGTDHHELYMNESDALKIVPELPSIYDEPFADISAIPTYLVSRFARKDVTVALSGDGGDEMLGGYNRHFSAPSIMNKANLLPHPIRKLTAGIIKSVPVSTWDSILSSHPQSGERMHKIANLLPLRSPEEAYRELLSHWKTPETLVVEGKEPLIPLQDSNYRFEKQLSFAERMMAGDALSYLPNDILVKVDRASMAASLEARAPLLDKRIYEYVWTLPEKMKIRDGKGKWLLRQVLNKHIPEELFKRPKQGFAMPVGDWLRGDLREWAEDLMSKEHLEDKNYLNPEVIHNTWNEHLQGKGNHATALWTVLSFQSWAKKWA